MTRCARCKRPLRNPVVWAGLSFGSTCAQAVGAAFAGSKAMRQRAQQPQRDDRTLDLFAEVQA